MHFHHLRSQQIKINLSTVKYLFPFISHPFLHLQIGSPTSAAFLALGKWWQFGMRIVFIIFPPPIFEECTIEDLSKKTNLDTVEVFAHFSIFNYRWKCQNSSEVLIYCVEFRELSRLTRDLSQAKKNSQSSTQKMRTWNDFDQILTLC